MQTNNTASFVVRFTQKISEQDGELDVQWRGKISHVQSNQEANFADFEKAISFMKKRLDELTSSNIQGKSEAEQEGILEKSWGFLNNLTKSGPKMILDTIKDPKAQVNQIQEQLKDVGAELGQKMEIDSWRVATKSDYKDINKNLELISEQILQINQRLTKIEMSKEA